MTFTRCRSAILAAVLKAALHGMTSLRSFALAPNLFVLCSNGKLFTALCSNRSPRDSKRGIGFHRLLKDKGLLSKWLAQKKFAQMKHCNVCSEHFEPTCCESEYRLDILPDNLRRKKPGESYIRGRKLTLQSRTAFSAC